MSSGGYAARSIAPRRERAARNEPGFFNSLLRGDDSFGLRGDDNVGLRGDDDWAKTYADTMRSTKRAVSASTKRWATA